MLTLRSAAPPLRRGLLCALAATAALPAAASAEGWLAPEPALTDVRSGIGVGVAPSGTPVLAYLTGDATPQVAVVVRRPGGTYERTAFAPETTGGSFDMVGVGVDAAGDVAVAYRRGLFAIYVASRAAGAAGFTNRTLAGGTAISTTNTAFPRFAVTPAGTILLSLPEFGSAGVVQGSFDVAPLTRQTLSYPAQPLNEVNAVLGVGSGSDAVLALTSTRAGADPNTGTPNLLVSRRGADGTFAAPTVVDDPDASYPTSGGGSSVSARFPTVVVGPDGSADVAWSFSRSTMAAATVDVRAVHVPAGTTVTDTPQVAREIATPSGAFGTHSVGTPMVARAKDGSAAVVVTDNGTSGQVVLTSTRPAGSAVFPGTSAAPFSAVSRQLLGVFGSGDGVEAAFQPGSTRVESAATAAGGGLGSLMTRYEPPAGTMLVSSVASSSGANAAIASSVTQGSPTNAVLTLRDATPPTLDVAGVPTGATAGTGVALTAAPADAIDAAPAVAWDFGDGTTGAGAAVSHTWSAAGSYAVRATATDASANATTATRTVTVSAPPPPIGKFNPFTGYDVPPAADTTAPTVSGAKLTPSRVTRRRPAATLSLTLSEPAALVVTVTTTRPGVKQGTTCKAVTKVKRGRKRCTRTVTVLTRKAVVPAVGATKVAITLRKPAKGVYTIAVVAKDAAGNASAPAKVKLTVR